MILQVLLIASISLFLLFYILLKFLIRGAVKEFSMDNERQVFIMDELVKTEKLNQRLSRVFRVDDKVSEFIDMYVIHSTKHKKYINLKYKDTQDKMQIKLLMYSKKSKYIGTLIFSEAITSTFSTDIVVPQNCSFIKLSLVDEIHAEKNNDKHLRGKNNKKDVIALIQTYAFFVILFPIAYLTIFILSKENVEAFFSVENSIFILILMGVLTVINFTITSRLYKKKTIKAGDQV